MSPLELPGHTFQKTSTYCPPVSYTCACLLLLILASLPITEPCVCPILTLQPPFSLHACAHCAWEVTSLLPHSNAILTFLHAWFCCFSLANVFLHRDIPAQHTPLCIYLIWLYFLYPFIQLNTKLPSILLFVYTMCWTPIKYRSSITHISTRTPYFAFSLQRRAFKRSPAPAVSWH